MRDRIDAVLRYGAYRVASALPAPTRPRGWRLRHRYRYRIFSADPARIRARVDGPPGTGPEQRRRYRVDLLARCYRDWIVDGDWDLTAEAIDARYALEGVLQHEFGGVDEEVLKRLARALRDRDDAPLRGGVLPPDLERYLVDLVGLATSLLEHGVRPQRVLQGRPTRDEITVCIGRTGEPILLLGGNHRVLLARYLDLPAVPVLVGGVHPVWLERVAGHGADRGAFDEALTTALCSEQSP